MKMSAFPVIFLIFLPLAEIYVFVSLGDTLGGGMIVLLCLATAFFGAFILRQQGLSALQQAQEALMQGRPPVKELVTGLLVIIAGVLLILPGFITDVLGLLLLTSWGRVITIVLFLRHVLPHIFYHSPATPGPQSRAGPTTIEGDFRINPDKDQN